MKLLCALLSLLFILTGIGTATAETDAISFVDPVVEEAVRSALQLNKDTPLTAEDLIQLTSFKCFASDIVTLSDLALCTNLQSFSLISDFENTYDFSPLSNLNELKSFAFYGVATNLSPIMSLPKLSKLLVSGSVKSLDFSPLAGKTNLEDLYLYCDVSVRDIDFTPLMDQTSIRQATLTYLSPEKLRPLLESWPNLEYLSLSYIALTSEDLAAMKTTCLKTLRLTRCRMIYDFTVLSTQPMLRRLDVRSCNVTNEQLVQIVQTLPELDWLDLGENEITDFSPLKSLKKLKTLFLPSSANQQLLAVREMLPDVEVKCQ